MKTKKTYFGTLSDGSKTYLYTVSNGQLSFTASDFGCTITNLIVKDRNGRNVDVVIGPATLSGYASEWGSFGAIVGRFANRIKGAKFTLDGKEYILNDNMDGNCLHGGFPLWEKEIWSAKFVKTSDGEGIRFTKLFEDGYQGFPGNLEVAIEYLLKNDSLILNYTAKTDKETPVSITNHSYFNLSGFGNILHEKLTLFSSKILELDEKSVPTGQFISVDGTAFDFQTEKTLEKDFYDEKVQKYAGYDHCFVTSSYNSDSAIPTKGQKILPAAILKDDKTGIKLELSTNYEGVQLYTANYVNHVPGKKGAFYGKQHAVCLETQNFPDSPNQKNFPSVILKPGKEFNAVTVLRFSNY